MRLSCGYSFFLSLPHMCTGIELSYKAKNKGNSDLVCEKNVSNGEPYLFTESS